MWPRGLRYCHTATACMVNCLCVAHAHVFVGCSNLSHHPVWDPPFLEWHTWLRNPSSPVAPLCRCATPPYNAIYTHK
jgi:hypothetical protein